MRSQKISLWKLITVMFFWILGGMGLPMAREEIRVRGSIICVNSQGNPMSCDQGPDNYAIQSRDKTYFFSPEDPKSGIFKDPRVRDREIEVVAWLQDESRLEIIRVLSVKQGRLYEIQYFCSVCNITAYVGGPCWCCQDEFEFREVPVTN